MNPRSPPKTPGSSIGYNLAGIAVLVLLMAVGVAYLVDAAGRGRQAPAPVLGDGNVVLQTISGLELIIPAAWFRDEGQIRQGFSDQIDLRFMLAAGDPPALLPIDVSLVPRSRVRPSSALLDNVYLHEFDTADASGVPGLVGKPLRDEAGFSGETVWYDALSPAPFVAKCSAPVEVKKSGRCLRSVYLDSGIAVIYAFDAPALAFWQEFDAQMALWLAQIGAN